MDTDAIKAFMISHLEKFIFGAFAILAALLVYSGLQKQDFMVVERTDPDQLSQMATQVKLQIDDDHSDAILVERIRPDLDIVAMTKRRDSPVDQTPYQPEKFWLDVDPGSVVRRTDPSLAQPIDLRLSSVVATVAQTTLQPDSYPLFSLEPADPVEVEVERRPRPRRNNRRNRGFDELEFDSGVDDFDLMETGAEMEMMEEVTPTRAFSASGDLSGYRPMPKDRLHPRPQVWSFIAGVALLPYKENYQAYELAFAEADGYNVGRDVPIYHDLQIQRADVTEKSIDELTEDDWVLRFDRKTHYRLAKRDWIGFAPEHTPSDYRDAALTLHIPPILLDDYYAYTSHDRLPKKSKQEIEFDKAQAMGNDSIIDLEEDLEDDSSVLAGPGGVTGTGGQFFNDDEIDFNFAGASFAGGLTIGRGFLEVDPVDHKLIRFFDFAGIIPRTSPQPGRTYVYRIRYGVVDPNFPQVKELQPSTSTLDPATADRVTKLVSEAERTNKRDGLWIRYSDWSEPTSPISLASLEDQITGPVTLGRTARVRLNNEVKNIPREPPTAEMITTRFSLEYGTRVPILTKVQPGMTLSAKAETADLVDPILMQVKKLPEDKARVDNQTTVVAIVGATPSANAENVSLPGHLLLMKPDGSLRVTDDVQDQQRYRIYSFAEERGK